MLKRKLLLCLLTVTVVCMSCTVALAGEAPYLRIVNRSGRTIDTVYLKMSKYGDYVDGEDDVNNAPLRNGEFVEIRFLDSREHRMPHDILVVYRDNTYDEWQGLDIYDLYEFGVERDGASSYKTMQ